MLHSHEIGRKHEERVEELLKTWKVEYKRKQKFETNQGAHIELDFWLPPTDSRPAIVIECKDFGVKAKSTADSRRRKAQEALYLLVQVRRHCPGTQSSRILIVTGPERFLPQQVQFLESELGPDFHVVSVQTPDQFQNVLGLNRK